jgi:hypothetical protein
MHQRWHQQVLCAVNIQSGVTHTGDVYINAVLVGVEACQVFWLVELTSRVSMWGFYRKRRTSTDNLACQGVTQGLPGTTPSQQLC